MKMRMTIQAKVNEGVARRVHIDDKRNQEPRTHGELPRVFLRQVAALTASGIKIADNKRQPAVAQISVLVSHGKKAPSAQHCVNSTTCMYYTCREMETACLGP